MLVNEVTVDVPTWTPPLYILYPATPEVVWLLPVGSVVADHASTAVEVVVPVTESPVGTEGEVVSGVDGVEVEARTIIAAEMPRVASSLPKLSLTKAVMKWDPGETVAVFQEN